MEGDSMIFSVRVLAVFIVREIFCTGVDSFGLLAL